MKPDEKPDEQTDDVPQVSADEPTLAAGIGTAYVGNDNDEQSHVAPTDNDGETVPREGDHD